MLLLLMVCFDYYFRTIATMSYSYVSHLACFCQVRYDTIFISYLFLQFRYASF